MIAIQGTEMNFGDMQMGRSYNQDFVINNRGDKQIIISEIVKSCTCTEAWMDSPVIPPGKDGVIHVRVTPGSTGVFLRSFTFRAGSSHTIKLKGTVVS